MDPLLTGWISNILPVTWYLAKDPDLIPGQYPAIHWVSGLKYQVVRVSDMKKDRYQVRSPKIQPHSKYLRGGRGSDPSRGPGSRPAC